MKDITAIGEFLIDLTQSGLSEQGILRFANKAAGITTSRHGAIPAMPIMEEMGEY